MAGEDKVKDKAPKTRKLKYLKCLTPHMTSHDAPPHMRSHDAPPYMTSNEAHAHMTSQDEPPITEPSHKILNVTLPPKELNFTSPHNTSHVAPSSSTSRVVPLSRTSITRKYNGLPHTMEDATGTSNVPHPHVAPQIR